MAINDPNYRYATQTWEADGVRTQYDIAFDGGYIRQSDVVAFSVLVDEETGLVTDRTIHALTFLTEDTDPVTEWKTAQVEITPAIPEGRRVVIFRSTEKSAALVNYTNGSILTEKNLDLANDQSVFGIAEIMDGLNAAQISIDSQVQQVIDINLLINEIYQEVLTLLESGGIVSVEPKSWIGEGDGIESTFSLPLADIDKAAFYDTYAELNAGTGDFVGLRPGVDYTITLSTDPGFLGAFLEFTDILADGIRWFTVLRGFAKPYLGDPPIYTTAPDIITTIVGDTILSSELHNALIVSNSGVPVTYTIRQNTGSEALDWTDGQFFSVLQLGAGQVTLVLEDVDGDLIPSPDYQAKTRGVGSIISSSCITASEALWAVSGDLWKPAPTPEPDPIPEAYHLRLVDRVPLSVTNIAAGTNRDSYIMPFNMTLNSIALEGIVANLIVAQAAGAVFTVDVNRNGTSILATKLTIDNTEKTSRTAAVPAVYAVGGDVLLKGDEITFDVDQIGTALAKGLAVNLTGIRTP